MCSNVKSVNNASIGDLFLPDSYVTTAISNIRLLKRVPKDSRVSLVENLSDKINGLFYNVENVTYWLVFLKCFLFFLEQSKRSGPKQTTAMSSITDKKRANFISLPKCPNSGKR